MAIPPAELSPEAKRGIIEAFVLREGTDYGEREPSLDDKVAQVERQLAEGSAVVIFNTESETIEILTQQQIRDFRDRFRDSEQ
ncbi:MAG: YheU family protein [Gammaproteobacteria bacterium]|nr:YheU family protein [Gammaproteobacteria bacterium]